jgi:hypothetical protein
MSTASLKETIVENAEELVRLHSRIHETLKKREESVEDRQKWEQACAEFHARYDLLAFPGGYDGALERIVSGDPLAMEAAICFLECRPHFFRSGYMFEDILRKSKRAPLSLEQHARLNAVVERLNEWRNGKNRNGTNRATR